MKKATITAGLFILGLGISGTTFGQGLYFGIGGGYGFAAAKSAFPADQKTTNTLGPNPSSFTSYTSRSASLGRGVNLGAYLGLMFNKTFGAELGIGYLIGSTNSSTNETDDNGPGFSSTDVSVYTVKSSMLRLVPTIRIQGGDGRIHPYAKAGLIIGLAGKVTEETMRTRSTPSRVDDDIITYSGGTSMGFHGALGISAMFTDVVGIFAEVSGNYQSWAPGKSSLTTSTSNGVDNLPNMTTNQKETTYEATYTTNNSQPSSGSPSQSSKIYFPFSSFGFNVGIHFNLGSK